MIQLSQTPRWLRVARASVLLLGGISAPALACANGDDPCPVDEVRKSFYESAMDLAEEGAKAALEGLDDEIDFEKQGCIDTYGLDMSSFSLSGLADGLMQSLKDAVCEAADNYVADQVDGLGASFDAPMGLGGGSVGLSKGGSGMNWDHETTELDFNFDQLIGDQVENLPSVNGGYFSGDYSGGQNFDDYDYVDSTGGRR